jgi:hypothetical protein
MYKIEDTELNVVNVMMGENALRFLVSEKREISILIELIMMK